MQVILKEDVQKLGSMGELVNVKPGYARNYLLPQGKAIKAEPNKVRQMQHEQRIIEHKKAKLKAAAEDVAKRIGALNLSISAKVGEQDKLFGSVTAMDVERALAAEGIQVDRKKITIAEPIKSLGEYKIPVKLDADVSAEVKVTVVAE